jgi:hypothetical protein
VFVQTLTETRDVCAGPLHRALRMPGSARSFAIQGDGLQVSSIVMGIINAPVQVEHRGKEG